MSLTSFTGLLSCIACHMCSRYFWMRMESSCCTLFLYRYRLSSQNSFDSSAFMLRSVAKEPVILPTM